MFYCQLLESIQCMLWQLLGLHPFWSFESMFLLLYH